MISREILIINKILKNKIIIMVKIKMKFIKKIKDLFMEEIAHKVYEILTTIKFKKNKILITIIQCQKSKIIKYSLITKKKENRS